MQWLSPAQCIGYVAFVLGVAAFTQTVDRRLKFLNASQSLVYAVHFVLLGNLPASSSSLISSVRSFLSLKTRSRLVAASLISINLAAGVFFVKSPAGWLPVVSSCAATLAMFYMRGVAMRAVLLACTFCWLANNVISGSIGGTLLEVVIAAVNASTIVRMLRPSRQRPACELPEARPELQ